MQNFVGRKVAHGISNFSRMNCAFGRRSFIGTRTPSVHHSVRPVKLPISGASFAAVLFQTGNGIPVLPPVLLCSIDPFPGAEGNKTIASQFSSNLVPLLHQYLMIYFQYCVGMFAIYCRVTALLKLSIGFFAARQCAKNSFPRCSIRPVRGHMRLFTWCINFKRIFREKSSRQ